MNQDGTTQCIIFPLRAKLSLMFSQQRPKVYGGRRVVLLPVLPWTDGDRPPTMDYGRVRGVPVLNLNCWVGFGLCAIDMPSIRLQDLKQTQLRPNFGSKGLPDVVHVLKPIPGRLQQISGVTRDSSGNALGLCNVELFRTDSDLHMETAPSNAAGVYTFKMAAAAPVQHYIVAYKAGSPDVAGTSVNTLTATPT